MARFVGEERFVLKVGQALIRRSADVGLVVDGVATSSGLEATEILDSPLHSVRIDERDVFSLPLMDALAFCTASSEFVLLRRQAFEAMKAKGMTTKDAVKTLNDPAVKQQIAKIADRKEALQKEAFEIKEKFDAAEKEILAESKPGRSSSPLVDPASNRDVRLQILINQEDQAEQNLIKKAAFEAQQEIEKIDTMVALDETPAGRAKADSLYEVALEKFSNVVTTLGTYTIPFYDLWLDWTDSMLTGKKLSSNTVLSQLRSGTFDTALMFLLPGIGKSLSTGTKAAAKGATELVGELAQKAANRNAMIMRNRRYGKEFEAHIGKMFNGAKVESQVAFKNGERCARGVKGSSIVDFLVHTEDGLIAIEAKRPIVPTTRNLCRMADRTGAQIIKAERNLPKWVRQRVFIDNRTQGLCDQIQADIKDKIIEKSKGTINDVMDIRFIGN
jgi:hypothetical protein